MASIGTEFVIKTERRPCLVDDKRAWFHQWIDKQTPILKVNAMLTQKSLDRLAEKMRQGIIAEPCGDVIMQNRTLGLIEYEDGTVAEVNPTSIRFDVEREKEQ